MTLSNVGSGYLSNKVYFSGFSYTSLHIHLRCSPKSTIRTTKCYSHGPEAAARSPPCSPSSPVEKLRGCSVVSAAVLEPPLSGEME